jgi:hypothetical protein
VLLGSIVPVDHNIHNVTLTVTAAVGNNTLQFEGAGISDGYGLNIDNVALIRSGDASQTNIVINGGFEQPNVAGSWGSFNNILGWSGQGIEVGTGSIYNSWPSQIV